jgi:hypothetical protein
MLEQVSQKEFQLLNSDRQQLILGVEQLTTKAPAVEPVSSP